MQEIKIGRSSSNNIVLKDSSVSRLHASIIIENHDIYIVDHGSTNGTFINGMRVKGRRTLTEGDILKVGNCLVPWKNMIRDVHEEKTTNERRTDNREADFGNNPYSQSKKSNSSTVLIGLIAVGLLVVILFLTDSTPARWVKYIIAPAKPSVVANSKEDEEMPELFGDYKHKVKAKIINNGSDGYVKIQTVVKDCDGSFNRESKVFIKKGETYEYEMIFEEVNANGCGKAKSEISTTATY